MHSPGFSCSDFDPRTERADGVVMSSGSRRFGDVCPPALPGDPEGSNSSEGFPSSVRNRGDRAGSSSACALMLDPLAGGGSDRAGNSSGGC